MVWGKCQVYRNQKMWEMLFDHLNRYYQKCQIGHIGHLDYLGDFAIRTGLEPVTSTVTG